MNEKNTGGEHLLHEDIERWRKALELDPGTPERQEAGRALFRPIIEKMDGREIIYDCRELCLMQVVYLEVNDDGFRAVAKPLQYIYNKYPPPEAFETPFYRELREKRPGMRYSPWDPMDFGASWSWIYQVGTAIKWEFVTDMFYFDPAVVAEVKAAAARKVPLDDVKAILDRGKKWRH